MALVPVPGSQLTIERGRPDPATTGAAIEAAIPAAVLELLGALWEAGHAAYLVGGSLRDLVLGRQPADWDLGTDARPERIIERFPGSVYENRFGTVAVRRDGEVFEITTFRTDHDYADFRRPHRIEFGDTIEADLARRDFTVNAMAWGARSTVTPDPAAGAASAAGGASAAVGASAAPETAPDQPDPPTLIDPYGGLADIGARVLRAVGDPAARFEEDALRMIRAVRLAATLDFEIETATLAGIQAHAPLVAHLSGERIAAELDKLLTAPTPSIGLRWLADTGTLAPISAELAAQRGIPQNKVPGEDLWDHTLRSVDAAPAARPVVRLAALLHDIGKPATLADGHFIGHDTIGAELAGRFLDRLRSPRSVRARIVALVEHHMWSYEPSWSDAAVRRFIGKIGALGEGALEELLALREADNIGSGLPASAGLVDELRARIAAELAADAVLDRSGLALDGSDLMRELGLQQGPLLGRILDDLLDRVIADPALNDRPTLLLLAQAMLTEDR